MYLLCTHHANENRCILRILHVCVKNPLKMPPIALYLALLMVTQNKNLQDNVYKFFKLKKMKRSYYDFRF